MIAFIEKIKLQLRANKYKNKDHKGGIAYVFENIKNGETVLDIGCNDGTLLGFYPSSYTLYGVDPSDIAHETTGNFKIIKDERN